MNDVSHYVKSQFRSEACWCVPHNRTEPSTYATLSIYRLTKHFSHASVHPSGEQAAAAAVVFIADKHTRDTETVVDIFPRVASFSRHCRHCFCARAREGGSESLFIVISMYIRTCAPELKLAEPNIELSITESNRLRSAKSALICYASDAARAPPLPFFLMVYLYYI